MTMLLKVILELEEGAVELQGAQFIHNRFDLSAPQHDLASALRMAYSS
jgi:hypothetical protein